MDKKNNIHEMLEDDPFGLLKDERETRVVTDAESSFIASFEEITSYVEEFGREPSSNMQDINEFKLYSRLSAIRKDPKKVKILKKYDFKGLLNNDEVKEASVEDLVAEDPFGLLTRDDVGEEIFTLKHVKPVERVAPDYLSRRRICKDFVLYKDMFSILHQEFDSKQRRLVRYKSADLNCGKFFSLGGVLLFLKSIDGDIDTKNFSSGSRDRFDGKTLCIFDNGTESDMLFRSLDKALQIDGYSISESLNEIASDTLNTGLEEDVFNGYIYVLRSRNQNVKHIEHLYKIGYTSGSVVGRIKNAKNEGTYLFDDVDVIATFRCLNMPSYDLEQILHDFFAHVKLDIDLMDSSRNIYRPKEWFQVDLKAIEDAIGLVIDRSLTDFVYDEKIRKIIRK